MENKTFEEGYKIYCNSFDYKLGANLFVTSWIHLDPEKKQEFLDNENQGNTFRGLKKHLISDLIRCSTEMIRRPNDGIYLDKVMALINSIGTEKIMQVIKAYREKLEEEKPTKQKRKKR